MLDMTPIVQKVAAKLASSPSKTIDINTLHRCLGHLRIDNCHTLINRCLVDGVDRIIGKETFCKGCAYGHSKRKHHPSMNTRTKQCLERVHINLCRPLQNSISGNQYFLLIIDKHTHYQWVEFMPKKNDTFTQLKQWKLWAEMETDLKLQFLKSDRGGEFGSNVFDEWLAAEGMVHEKSALYEHKQMCHNEPCVNSSVQTCQKDSGCMLSKLQCIS